MPRLIYVLAALFCALPAVAAEISLENLYENPINQTLPEVIILHNSLNPCENCPKAIDMIINLLKQNYSNKVHAYLINAAKHPEFATTFQAYDPLELIVIRISDGAAFGYEKLGGLESAVGNTEDFNRRVSEFIDNFLSF